MKNDLINFKNYYTAAAQKIPAESFFMQSVNHKFRHSVEVLHFGQRILRVTPELAAENEDFIKTAQQALLFHDVGRFTEAVQLYEAAQNKGDLTAAFTTDNHGVIGYELLKNDTNYNDMRILFAVRWHGQMPADIRRSEMYQTVEKSPQFAEIIKILRLVRDADKLANLRVIKEQDHLRHDLFYYNLTPETLNAPISGNVKKQFFAGQVILSATVHSFADRILQVLSWIYDFNYQATKLIFNTQKFSDYLLNELKKYHHNSEDIAQIRAATEKQMRF